MPKIEVQVTGLKECKANFQSLSKQVQEEIGRESLREAAWTLARPMRAATYSTFNKITGGIRAGLAVAIHKVATDKQLVGYVEEYPQNIAGTSPTPFAAAVRKRLSRKTRKAVPTSYVAIWWRFLEFGTGPRHAQRTPTFLRTGKVAQNPKRQGMQLARAKSWLASGSRGGIKSRRWIRPIFGSKAPDAIQSFDATIKKLIESSVNAMQK